MGTVLVTGSARRIGRALALGFAAAGHDLCLHYFRSRAEAESLAREVEALGRRAVVLQADLGRENEAAALVARCEGLGPLTGLVNNAALYLKDTVGGFSPGDFDLQAAVNLKAPLILASAFAAQLAAEHPGWILNMLDFKIAALPAKFLSYTVSKAGLAAATEMLALALAPRIRVNAIAPGLVLASEQEPEAAFDRLQAATPLKRGVQTADIVEAALYLARAASVTGQTLYLDSGQRFVSRKYL